MSASILCLLFRCNKNLANFQTWNNIVNALTQYVHPIEDSAESHSECRKVNEDI